jgi:hypothetical protein
MRLCRPERRLVDAHRWAGSAPGPWLVTASQQRSRPQVDLLLGRLAVGGVYVDLGAIPFS